MNSERHEHIEAYLAGMLNPAEHAAFEKELEENGTLRRELELHRMAGVVIQHGLNVERKAQLREVDAELDASKPGRSVLIRRLAAAASVLVLIAVGAHFYAHGNYSNTAVANRFYAPVHEDVFRSEQQTSGNTALRFQEAQQFFEDGAYNQAIEHYLTIIQENDLQKEQAEWNLLMCYLAKDPDGTQFRVMLDHISSDPAHSYYQKCQDLQRTMEGALFRIVNR